MRESRLGNVAIHPDSGEFGGSGSNQLGMRPFRIESLRSAHANASRQRLRHGLSRGRPGPAAGLRARLAVRLSHLVWRCSGRCRSSIGSSRSVLAALFSRALGRRQRHLFDRAACRRRDRLHRETGCRAGGSDGAFPRRAYLVSRRAAAARSVAQADPGRARRRTRCHARSRLRSPGPRRSQRRIAAAAEKIAAGDVEGGLDVLLRCDRRPRRLGAAAGDAEAATARQRLHPDRAGPRQTAAVLESRRGIDQERRRCSSAAPTPRARCRRCCARWRPMCPEFKDRDDFRTRRIRCSSRRRRNFARSCWSFWPGDRSEHAARSGFTTRK